MIWYFLGVGLHILAVVLWIGQMIYRMMVVDPITKRFGLLESDGLLREISNRLDRISWPCLWVTVVTGIFLLYYQGVGFQEVRSGHLFLSRFGQVLEAKLLLVSVMIVIQFFVGPERKILSWFLVLLGLAVIGLSALLIR